MNVIYLVWTPEGWYWESIVERTDFNLYPTQFKALVAGRRALKAPQARPIVVAAGCYAR